MESEYSLGHFIKFNISLKVFLIFRIDCDRIQYFNKINNRGSKNSHQKFKAKKYSNLSGEKNSQFSIKNELDKYYPGYYCK